MNHSVYIFGNLGQGHFQFPEDYSADILKISSSSIKYKDQISIIRDGNLIYYAYTRNLDDNRTNYIGFAITFNSVYYLDNNDLFSIFDSVIQLLLVDSKLLQVADNGDIVANDSSLLHNAEQTSKITEFIRTKVNALREANYKSLPARNLAVDPNAKFEIDANSAVAVIEQTIRDYNHISVFRSTSDAIASTSGFSNKIAKLSQKIEELSAELNTKIIELEALRKEKKRTKAVAWLCIFIALISIASFALFSNLSSKISGLEHERYELKTEVKKLKEDVASKTDKIQSLNDSIFILVAEKDDLSSKINKVNNTFPLVIKSISIGNSDTNHLLTDYGNTIYASESMFVCPKVEYYGLINSNKTFKIKFFLPDGTMSKYYSTSSPMYSLEYSYSVPVNISEGDNSMELSGWGGEKKGHWSAGSYKIEIWYDDICLGVKKFRLY